MTLYLKTIDEIVSQALSPSPIPSYTPKLQAEISLLASAASPGRNPRAVQSFSSTNGSRCSDFQRTIRSGFPLAFTSSATFICHVTSHDSHSSAFVLVLIKEVAVGH